MRELNLYRQRLFLHWLLILIGSLLIGLTACGNSDSPDSAPSGYGELFFSIHWHDGNGAASSSDTQSTPGLTDCASEGVVKVQCSIYAAPDTLLAESPEWTCEDHDTTMESVNVGSDRILVCLGFNDADEIIHMAYKSNITVQADQATNVGYLDSYRFETTLTAPSDDDFDLPANRFDLSWEAIPNAYEYQLELDDHSTFDAPLINLLLSQTIFHPDILESATTYYWRVTPVDRFGNFGRPSQPRHFSTAAGGGTPDPDSCIFQIFPESMEFGYNANVKSFFVDASRPDCNWRATSSADWIIINSGASGIGDGTVFYRVLANKTTEARSGFISVAGLTHKVTQQAPPPENTAPWIGQIEDVILDNHFEPADSSVFFQIGDNESDWLDLQLSYSLSPQRPYFPAEMLIQAPELGEGWCVLDLLIADDYLDGPYPLSHEDTVFTVTVDDGFLDASTSFTVSVLGPEEFY